MNSSCFLLILQLAFASLDFSSMTYPFPKDEVIDLDVNEDQEKYDCVYDLMQDGKCDLYNNKPECQYDGGDCCRATCETNCKAAECKYTCGDYGYYCIEDTSCANCTHGTCSPISKCFSTEVQVKLGVLNCQRNNIAHGNSSTADQFCGKDINKTVSHSFDQYGFHYPGCGLPQSICSTYQCCSDIELNNITSETCTSEVNTYKSFNLLNRNIEERTISCIDLFKECFVNNSITSKGECCECEEGWVGKNCDFPSCYPSCKHGKCVDIDKCECDDGWSEEDCSIATCKDCQNGKCIAPDVCFCDYGWNGTACDVPYASPACVYGVAVGPDTCKCVSSYTGLRCEIPKCSKCNYGWCISPEVCECYPPYYTKDSSQSWCTDLHCDEIFGPSCTNCTNSTCTRCLVGYFLNQSQCTECSSFNLHCLECNMTRCLLCSWPYTPEGFDCVFPGYIEFSSKYFSVLKSNGSVEISVYRVSSVRYRVEVSYKLIGITARIRKEADFGYIEGSLYFEPNIVEQKIIIPVYNKFYDTSAANRFYILLYNPVNAVDFVQNLTRVTDFSWSDKGINVTSYCMVEIWDDPAQALPALTSFTQEHPETVLTSSVYNFTFKAFNSNSQEIFTAVFMVQVRKIVTEAKSDPCVFGSNSFEEVSVITSNSKVISSGWGYTSLHSLAKGLYTLTPWACLPGAYVKIYTNVLLQGPAIEEGIRAAPGWYNNYTMPLGNSSSQWDFVHFPSITSSGPLSVSCSDNDLVSVSIDEQVLLDCTGSCSSSPVSLVLGLGQVFSIKYFHRGSSPGFSLHYSLDQALIPLSEVYAVNKTQVTSQVFAVEKSEC